MSLLSSEEIVSVALIGMTVAVVVWYQTGMTGIQRWTTTFLSLVVSSTTTAATTLALRRWNFIQDDS
jgi:hypothetical protein